jgi:hypothetical protein
MKRIFSALLLLGILAGHAGAEVLAPEKLLPEDTLAVYTIPDFNKIREVSANSPHGQFWNEPAMQAFKDKFLSKLTAQYITPLEHDLSIHLSDYTNLPQGQVTLALTQDDFQGKQGQAPGILFLMDSKDKSAQVKTNLADLKKKWVDAGKSIKTEKIRDIDFSVVFLSSDDIPKSLKKHSSTNSADEPEPFENPETKKAPKPPIYIGQAESLLILGNSSRAIEKILARMSGAETKPLSDVAEFSSGSSILHNSQIYVWLNTKSMIDTAIKSRKSDDEESATPVPGFKPQKLVSALGINTLNAVFLGYEYAGDGAHVNVLLASPESTRAGLMKILAGEQKETAPPSFVPADAVKFQRWRLNGKKTYDALRKMIGDFNAGYLNGIDLLISSAEGAAKEKDPAFSLDKDLFGNLGDDMISYEKAPKADATVAAMSQPPSLYLIGSPNPERLMSAIRALMVLAPQAEGTPKEREFLGHKIFTLPNASDPSRNMVYTSSSGYLALANDPALLEEYLRSFENPAKPLRELAGFSEATSKIVGGETSLLGFSNESELMKSMFALAAKSSTGEDPLAALAPALAAAGAGNVTVKDWLDLSLLPPYEKISKYFGFSVYSFNANSDGLLLRGFSPIPAGLKK